jgi:chorismate mutase
MQAGLKYSGCSTSAEPIFESRAVYRWFMRLVLVLASVFAVTCGSVLLSEERDLNHYYEIAKQDCQDIFDIRREINRINSAILRLLAERTAYVKRAGDLKFQTTKIAEDRQRVAEQEKILLDKSMELGLPAEISLPAFQAIVEASTQFQQRYIDHLSLCGEASR